MESQILAGMDEALQVGGIEPFAVQPMGAFADFRLENAPFFRRRRSIPARSTGAITVAISPGRTSAGPRSTVRSSYRKGTV